MSYSLCAVVVPSVEESICNKREWPFVSLAAGVSLIPLARDYLLLTDGDETSPSADFEFVLPPWLSDIVSRFSRSAYIESAFSGGQGMQASIVFAGDQILDGPVISSAAINFALRHLGIDDERSLTFLGVAVSAGDDPFDVVGLGRHRCVVGWLGEIGEPEGRSNHRQHRGF